MSFICKSDAHGQFFLNKSFTHFWVIYHIVKLQNCSSLDGRVIATKMTKCLISLKALQSNIKVHFFFGFDTHNYTAQLPEKLAKGKTREIMKNHVIFALLFLNFIYLGFYVAFNTVQVISRRVVGRAEETSTYSWSRFCTVNC